MRDIQEFLRDGETISESTKVGGSGFVDYDIHAVQREGLKDGDEVILDIRFMSECLVLIGGNPLDLEVIQGDGIVDEIDLKTGERTTRILFSDSNNRHQISPENTLYWYLNPDSSSNFLVRDHCDDFDPKNEPTLEKVAEAVVQAFRVA